jgi:8-oxo-dGTP diphosphatase
MSSLGQKILSEFGHRLRVRVCGICTRGDSLLLVRHRGIGPEGIFWAPPGGGVEFGVSVEDNLIREIREETGYIVQPGELLFVHEFLDPPLHAVELFFRITITGGTPVTGTDPEMPPGEQIIEEVRFVPFGEIRNNRGGRYHAVLNRLAELGEIYDLKGFLRF